MLFSNSNSNKEEEVDKYSKVNRLIRWASFLMMTFFFWTAIGVITEDFKAGEELSGIILRILLVIALLAVYLFFGVRMNAGVWKNQVESCIAGAVAGSVLGVAFGGGFGSMIFMLLTIILVLTAAFRFFGNC